MFLVHFHIFARVHDFLVMSKLARHAGIIVFLRIACHQQEYINKPDVHSARRLKLEDLLSRLHV